MKVRRLYHSNNRQRWLRKPVVNQAYRHWLTDTGSLTARLKTRYVDFNVKTLTVEQSKINLDEASALGLYKEYAYVREVLLYGGGQPVVFAHSVLPKQSLRGVWCTLGRLGNKPLGEALFKNPKVKRTALEFKKLGRHTDLYQHAVQHIETPPAYLWARRSVFSLHCAHILVTEVFLPNIHDALKTKN